MKLHLVDGTYELFRAHFSKRPPHTAPEGWDAKATVGVVSSLLTLVDDPNEKVTHIAVAFDNPIRSFRNDLYPGYKTEEGVAPELLRQFDPVEEAVAALGIAVWSMRDFEADDGLATGAARFASQVEQVRIYTPDKDLGQCIRGQKVVQYDRRQLKEIDESALIAMRGIKPTSIPDWLALTGDSADGFPGLPGFGEKTAAALLGKFEKLEAIPDDPRQWPALVRGADRLAKVLSQSREEAQLYRKLATLVEDAPVAKSLDQVAFKGVPRKKFLAWCDKLGVNTLKERPTRWEA